MTWLIFLSVFCVGLTLFIYLKKGPKQAAPDYSYIIFKDYTSATIGSIPYCGTKAKEVAEEVIKKIDTTRNMGKESEETPVATLHFED
jgi:hypothetical protein